MRTKLKIFRFICLAFCLFILSVPNHSFAKVEPPKEDTTVTIGNVKGQIGDIVEVPVALSNSKNEIAAYGLEINFDNTALKIIGVKDSYGSIESTKCSKDKDGCFMVHYDNSKGFLRAIWADPSAGDRPINKDIDLFTIQIEIQNAAKIGESSLTIQTDKKQGFSFLDPTNHPLAVHATPGELTVTENNGNKDPDDGGSTTDPSNGDNGGSPSSPSNGDNGGSPSNPSNGDSGGSQSNPSNGDNGGSPTSPTDEDKGNPSSDKGNKDNQSGPAADNDSQINKLPQTGDDSYIDTYLSIGMVTILAILVTMWVYQKRKKAHQD